MRAYKSDVVVVIKMGTYIHGVLILCGCLFYGTEMYFPELSEAMNTLYNLYFHFCCELALDT